MTGGQLASPPSNSGLPQGPERFAEVPDEKLLEQFVRQRDGVAFAALVARHGKMVLGVCRRVLRNHQDAEDAFQATFLVLVRKADSLNKPELLANWLYGVAFRTAQQARVRAARRTHHERQAASMAGATSLPETERQELLELLDRELFRLPEKYRAALVLCYLEGKTNEEAARQLGWPTGSMSARLARGRELLRDRLTGRRRNRQGALAAFPPVLLAVGLDPITVPPLLADATVHVALSLLGTKTVPTGLLAPTVQQLMEATLKDLAKWRPWALGVLAALLAALLLGGIAYAASDGFSPGGGTAGGSCHPPP